MTEISPLMTSTSGARGDAASAPIRADDIALTLRRLAMARPRVHALVAPVAQPLVANVAGLALACGLAAVKGWSQRSRNR